VRDEQRSWYLQADEANAAVAHMPRLLAMLLKRVGSDGPQTHIAEAVGLIFEIGNMGFEERQYLVEGDIVFEVLALYSPEAYAVDADSSDTRSAHLPDAAPATAIVNTKARRRWAYTLAGIVPLM
jgi:hypothetical protein